MCMAWDRSAPLLRFGCDARALEELADGGTLEAARLIVAEPLGFQANISLASGKLSLALAIQIPDLSPYSKLGFAGEVGVLDAGGELRRACSVDRTFRPPVGRVEKLGLGDRDVLVKLALSGLVPRVWFGLLINDLALLPENPHAGLKPLGRAFLRPEFITRRLTAENARLRGQLRDLEGALGSALSVACPVGPEGVGSRSLPLPGERAAGGAPLTGAVGSDGEASGFVSLPEERPGRPPPGRPPPGRPPSERPPSERPLPTRPPRTLPSGGTSGSGLGAKPKPHGPRGPPRHPQERALGVEEKARGAARRARGAVARENPAELRALQAELSELLTALAASLALLDAEGCVVCSERPADVLFIPCSHVCCCAACAGALPGALCPLCRTPIAGQKALQPC
jgi:hypothetical protein